MGPKTRQLPCAHVLPLQTEEKFGNGDQMCDVRWSQVDEENRSQRVIWAKCNNSAETLGPLCDGR
jgi:hypothetical protein